MKAQYYTIEELLALEDRQVFEWVKTGHWSMADFRIWVLKIRGAEFEFGWNTCEQRVSEEKL